MACIFLNLPDEALVQLEADLRASPGASDNVDNFIHQGLAHLLAGRWTEAITAMDRALALHLGHPGALITKAVMYHRDGRAADARELLRRMRQAEPASTLAVWERGFTRALARSPVREELLQLLRSLWSEAEFAA